jgi:hypothetical protein
MPLLERVLRLAATALTMAVLLGFALFAIDQAGEASDRRRETIVGTRVPDPSAAQERRRERQHGAVREVIDDANDVLLKPFAGVTDSRDPWVARGVPTALAVLVYGLGLSFLASFTRGRFR